MNKSDFYQNLFPLENLLPDLKEDSEFSIIENCDTSPDICDIFEQFNPEQLNAIEIETARIAGDFYRNGYEAAQQEIEKKLMPCKIGIV